MGKINAASKFFIFLMLAMVMVLATPLQTYAEKSQLKWVVNGNEVTFSPAPIIDKGTVYVPLLPIFEKLGFSVTWNAADRVVSAKRGTMTVTYYVDGSFIVINGATYAARIESMTVKKQLFIPVRLISEAVGARIEWDAGKKTVYLSSPPKERKIELSFSSQIRSQLGLDEERGLSVNVMHYGVQDNSLYTLVYFQNLSQKDLYLNIDPDNLKIIRSYSKQKDPMPPYNDTEAFEEWKRNNNGFSEVGSNVVAMRKYVQNQAGGLTDFLLPAGKTEQMIFIAPVVIGSPFTINGSYGAGIKQINPASLKLHYEVETGLELGQYSFMYTMMPVQE
ncbi:copper amine oxidase N-terminal domain-containing protein [Paenibacillus algorifonticola]|uniref:copper amine oxidase N-terminal domain-containing protein n=1 Tax=Paenibacillus algorifonticola TaxID=684063 RepID=UPI003D2AE896